jgi:AcrR family transcriptional regulator
VGSVAQPSLRAAQRAVTQSRILGSAYSLFAEQGFHGPSMEEIAARAGVNRGTVYLHFKSKAEILSALVLETNAGIEPIFDRLSHVATRREAISIALDAVDLWEGKMGRVLSILAGATGSDPVVDELMTSYRVYTLMMGRKILEGYGVPRRMARARSSMVYGMAMETMNRLARGQSLGISRQAAAEAFADLFLAATRVDCGADRPAG